MTREESKEIVEWIIEVFPATTAAQAQEMRAYLTDPATPGPWAMPNRPSKPLVEAAVKCWALTHHYMDPADLCAAIAQEQQRRDKSAEQAAKRRLLEQQLEGKVSEAIAAMSETELRELYDAITADDPPDFRAAMEARRRQSGRPMDLRSNMRVRGAVRQRVIELAKDGG